MREFLRGAVRLHILFHVANSPVHGAWLSEELAEHGYRISPGSLYPTLHAMEEAGLLSSGRAVVDGRARRVYAITPSGLAALEEAKAQLRELAREVLGAEWQ